MPVPNGAAHPHPDLRTLFPPDLLPVIDAQAVIDQALELVFSEACRLGDRIGMPQATAMTLADLRAGPFGRDLARLALVAAGSAQESRESVIQAIDEVLQLLFWPAGSGEYTVPRTFWATDLGRMLARAKFRAFGPTDLLGITSAAQRLGVSRPTVYRWMDNRMLDYVHDEVSGRTFIVGHDIDRYEHVNSQLPA